MLPSKYRLSLRTEFKRIKKNGRLVHGKLFSLLVSKEQRTPNQNKFGSGQANNKALSRFGFIVSSKVSKKAFQRNRAKRQLSEAIYGLMPRVKAGFDGVFLVKKTIVGRQFGEIQKEMEQVLRKAGLI